MKNTKLLLTFIALSFTLSISFADHKEHRLTQIQVRLDQVFQKNLIKTLGLTGEKKDKVLKILKDCSKRKSLLIDKLWHVRHTLKDLEQKKNVEDTELAKILQKMKHVQKEIDHCDEKALRQLKKVLSKKEIATYIVLKHKTMHQLKQEVRKRLKDKDNMHKYAPVF